MAQSYTLADAFGNLWSLQVNDEGRIITTSIASGSAALLFLNDPTGRTSWQVIPVPETGVLEVVSVANQAQYPVILPLQSAGGATYWSIGVTAAGVLTTTQITSVVAVIPSTPPVLTPFEIPLQPTPQTLQIQLGSSLYNLNFYWNIVSLNWMMDISDVNNDLLVGGIPLVTGTDLLDPFGYLEIDGELVVQTDNDPTAVPTFQNLGVTGHLYFLAPQAA